LTVVLAITGYVASTSAHAVAQPTSALAGIVISFSVIPAVIIAASLVSLARYRLRKADIDESIAVAA
jgi:Na+/melibiose symporter-like transporter